MVSMDHPLLLETHIRCVAMKAPIAARLLATVSDARNTVSLLDLAPCLKVHVSFEWYGGRHNIQRRLGWEIFQRVRNRPLQAEQLG